ncbi:6-pyruvoyl trahydropterin synthase family protein [Streptomyces flavofungini]|uniref:6-carboxy-5,6,7,8-tetrahydropterin synthase n=1 Tax=Streptomyces flavofungini TaxID=68200 RepID=A0ABS0X7E0_9ACTN|nr:6-carboxytetrahydropterin synthase [Streptomyces flavofungini]MBJ3809126.1 6-carboxytetrahydropterin synthase [Streptomyces flavofungini]GHC68678.1 6-carboxy-5,6,7,8-tetrahydropterin synthase [Streptomyces flavofungini]
MFTITKEFHFSASHRLDHLPPDHPCGRLHGHNYIVVLELSAASDELTRPGFVRDYGELGQFKKWLDETVDHRHLNDALADRNPSAENIALWIYQTWTNDYPELTAVRVSETPKTWATYRPAMAVAARTGHAGD